MSIKISVITPTYNAVKSVENAIWSVLVQDYDNNEHIIVDGASTDGTIDILKKYPHLKWISEPDEGQADAMRKGFEMAAGDVIVYLNADDYFLAEAFSKVMPSFLSGAKFVVGDIVVEKDNEYFINVPRVDLEGMLRHWEMNAYSYNPVGYFYVKEVQEVVPINTANKNMMDLEFLLDAATRFDFTKIKALLGVYRCVEDTKTVQDQNNLHYWTENNFRLIDRYLPLMSEKYQRQYAKDRRKGYEMQRRWKMQSIGYDESQIRAFERILSE